MRVIENKEWTKQIVCRACTSVIEIEFSDLSVPSFLRAPVTWTCCKCKTENEVDPIGLPAGRSVRQREPKGVGRGFGPRAPPGFEQMASDPHGAIYEERPERAFGDPPAPIRLAREPLSPGGLGGLH